MKLTKIDINSVTIKDDNGAPDPNLAINWEYEKSDDEEVSEIEILMPRTVIATVNITNGHTLEVWGGNSTSTDKKYFNGYVYDIIPEGALIKIIGKNKMLDLVRRNVNHVYDSGIDASAGEVSEIAEDLIETYGGMNGTVQPSGTEDGKRLDQFKCINADVFERLMALKRALDWQVRYDDEADVVYFEPKGYTNSGKTLTVGTEIVGVPTWDYDTTNMINDLRVDGAYTQTDISEDGKIETTADYLNESILLTKTPDIVELYMDAADPPTTQKTGGTKDSSSGHFYYIDRENKKIMPATGTTFTTDHFAIINYVWSAPAPIHMKNQASIDSYGLFEKQIELSDISSVADAESRAQNILGKRSVPFVTGKFPVRSTNVPNVREIVSIVDNLSVKNPSGDYVVERITYKWPSPVEELNVGDKTWRLADWQTTTEERLKRLEENFIRNQDILLELVDIQNTDTNNLLKSTPRYFISYSQDIRDGGGEYSFVLNHPNAGVLGVNKLGARKQAEIMLSMHQYENTYTENFFDIDFDSGGSASWSTTGSVTFTSGQVAESLTFDYNNGTVTVAKLTSTEESGSFTYEMTADGTNWDEVNSGLTHTFINSGTDLRWRATEDAASTGEISKIIVSDYH